MKKERDYDMRTANLPEASCSLCVEIEASRLMQGGREVIILHNGERYKLRVTAQQKLILTK